MEKYIFLKEKRQYGYVVNFTDMDVIAQLLQDKQGNSTPTN